MRSTDELLSDLQALARSSQSFRNRMVDELVEMGGVLRCEVCHVERPLGDVGAHVAEGWPKCCGYTMRWVTAAQLADEDGGEQVTEPLTEAQRRALDECARHGTCATSNMTGDGLITGTLAKRLVDRGLLKVVASHYTYLEVELTDDGRAALEAG